MASLLCPAYYTATFNRGRDRKKRKSRKALLVGAGLLGGAAMVGVPFLLKNKLRPRVTQQLARAEDFAPQYQVIPRYASSNMPPPFTPALRQFSPQEKLVYKQAMDEMTKRYGSSFWEFSF